jgi:hypothetical protein
MSTTATDEAVFITAADIKALKKAESIVFSFYEGKATIRGITERGNERTEVEVKVEGGIEHRATKGHYTTGFSHFASAQYSVRLRSLWKRMRAGDRVVLGFRPDYLTNDYAKYATTATDAGTYTGLHADALFVYVYRGGEISGPKCDESLIDVGICPDNSARMVRP